MQALVVTNDEEQAARIRHVIAGSDLGYTVIDTVPFASAYTIRGQYEVFVVHIPHNNAQEGLDVVRALAGKGKAMILAVGPSDDAKLVMQVFRQGANEYLDQTDLAAELRASLVRLRTRQVARVEGGRIIGVLSASGGCGASTLAANLGILLARSAGHSVLVEMRTAAADQAVLLDLRPEHTLAELCCNLDRLDANMFQQALAAHPSGMNLLAASNKFDDIALVTAKAVSCVLGFAHRLFPFVLVDLDRSLRAEQVTAISQSDLLLLVLRLDMASLGNAKNVLHHLKDLGFAENRIQGVASRYGQARELPLGRVEEALGIPISYQVPDDPARMNIATNEGVPVVLKQPWSKPSRSLSKLATDLKDRQELYRRGVQGPPAPEAQPASRSWLFGRRK